MTKRILLVLSALTLFACAKRAPPPLPGDSVAADAAVSLATPKLSPPGAPRASEPLGAIEVRVFPVDLVMEHQADIALDAAQRDAITKEVARAQADLVKLQFDLEAEKEKLVKVLDGAKVDEEKAKQAAAALMTKENAIKAAHLAMLVRVKNALTDEQQKKLKALRDDDVCARDGGR
jgi:hypothetical protein